MATERPRVYVTLDEDLYEEAEKLAQHKKISLSLFLRDKIKEAMEWHDTMIILKDQEAVNTIKESLREIKQGEIGKPWREVLKKCMK